jgi:hypothetical protein
MRPDFFVKNEPVLPKTEWNFETDNLPENELRACHAHEYGREIAKRYPPISVLLETKWRYERLPKKHPERSRWIQVSRKLADLGLPVSILSPGAVDLNWYSLQREFKKVAVSVLSTHENTSHGKELSRLSMKTLRGLQENLGYLLISHEMKSAASNRPWWRGLEPSHLPTMEQFQLLDQWLYCMTCGEDREQVEYGFFAIDWKAKDTVLIEAFTNWVKQQRTEMKRRGIVIKKRPSRGGYRDQLRWLGALRVREHYSRKSLQAGQEVPIWRRKESNEHYCNGNTCDQ